MEFLDILSFILVVKLILYQAVAQNIETRGTSQVFCLEEEFKARCGTNQVVLIKEALFGRMQLNRCVRVDAGNLGCHSGVLKTMDKLCSGRTVCDVTVLASVFNVEDPCLEMKRYLQVTYTCLSVMPSMYRQCILSPSSWPRYLANSQVINQNSCGTASNRWRINIGSFQTLNITLLDFSAYENSGACVDYATVTERAEDGSRPVTACGGNKRSHIVMSTMGNSVEIELKPPDELAGLHYLIYYEVTGCFDLPMSADMLFARDGNHVTVSCRESSQEWRMDCREGRWFGTMQNCTIDATAEDLKGYFKVLPTNILVALVVAIAVVVSVSIVVFGLICWKRVRGSTPQNNQVPIRNTGDLHSQYHLQQELDLDATSMYDKIPAENKVKTNTASDVYKVYYQKQNVYKVTEDFSHHRGSVGSHHFDPKSHPKPEYL